MQNSALSIILKEDYSWRDEHRAEDDYLVQLRALPIISPEFVPAYHFNHTLPAFSSKIRYHERKFHNAVTDYLNRFRFLLINPDDAYIAFQLKKHNERTRVALNSYYAYMSKHQDLLNALTDGSCVDYYSDRATKESITLASLMFWALIWCNMEVQHMFEEYIRPDNRLSVDDHFYRLLMIAPLKLCCVQPLASTNVSRSVSSNLPNIPSAERLAEYLPDVSDIIIEQIKDFREKAEPKGFFLLPKVQAISRPNQALLIRELQTAMKPFRFAMAHYLGWYTYLEEHVPGYQESGKRAGFFAELFEVNERDAKGYINVLKEDSKENNERYNSRAYLSDVEAFYQKLLPTL
ncbi:MAG: hypothetical protein ACI30J_09605 [Paludibacteraceae bacterium]